jgi:hypothetical protein
MPLTIAELREAARRLSEAAERASSPGSKRRLAGTAFLLAQAAEQIERQDPPTLAPPQDRAARLVADALDERTRAVVEAFLSEGAEKIGDTLRDIRRWRMRAEELRTVADQTQSRSAKLTFLRVAADYDNLANHAEARLTQDVPCAPGEDVA